jgi:hypothetical protein
MRRALVLAGLVFICAVMLLPRGNGGVAQDQTDERLSSLETRVANLERSMGTPSATSEENITHDIEGTLTLVPDDPHTFTFDLPCFGSDGYDDLYPGAQVTVSDSASRLIATGSIYLSKGVRTPPLDSSKATLVSGCEFAFNVLRVPDTDFYSIKIANREGPVYSRADLEAMNWTVALTIG